MLSIVKLTNDYVIYQSYYGGIVITYYHIVAHFP